MQVVALFLAPILWDCPVMEWFYLFKVFKLKRKWYKITFKKNKPKPHCTPTANIHWLSLGEMMILSSCLLKTIRGAIIFKYKLYYLYREGRF